VVTWSCCCCCEVSGKCDKMIHVDRIVIYAYLCRNMTCVLLNYGRNYTNYHPSLLLPRVCSLSGQSDNLFDKTSSFIFFCFQSNGRSKPQYILCNSIAYPSSTPKQGSRRFFVPLFSFRSLAINREVVCLRMREAKRLKTYN
jgi:hypothetical protein